MPVPPNGQPYDQHHSTPAPLESSNARGLSFRRPFSMAESQSSSARAQTPPTATVEPLNRAEIEARLAAAGITIQPARWRDIPAMARIQRQAFPPRLAYGATTLAVLLALPSTRCLNAYRNGEPIGTIIGDRHNGDSRVVNLAVRPDARRLGIGAALLLRLEDELPHGDMVLMVQEENTGAHTLYRRAGYVDAGVATNYYGWHRNGIWMRKRRSGNPSTGPRPDPRRR